jgi:CheY-like chemotaxis protein
MTRELLTIALADAGYRCVGATDVPTALALVTAQRPALILAATVPAGVLGRAFLAAYRRAPGPRAPILVLTTDVAADAWAAADGVATLAEPFDLDDLLAVVARLTRDGTP